MASDRPLFDDEELPAWLRKAGITPGSGGENQADQPAQQPPQSTGQSMGQPSASGTTADDLSWLDGQPATQDVPWMQDVIPSAPASGTPASDDMPPWMADVVPTGTSSAPPTPAQSSQDLPPWMQGSAPAGSEPAPATSDDLPPWMQGAVAEEAAQPAPSNFSDLPSWAQDNAAPAEDIGGGSPFDEPPAPEIDWGQAAGTTAPPSNAPRQGAGLTGALPWRQDVSDAGAPGQPVGSTESQANWLQDFGTPEVPQNQAESPSQGDLFGSADSSGAADNLDWLNDAAPAEQPQQPASFAEPEPPEQPAAAEPPRQLKSLKSLPSLQPKQEPPAEPEQPAAAEPPRQLKSLKSLPSLQPKQETPPQPEPAAPGDNLDWLDDAINATSTDQPPAASTEKPQVRSLKGLRPKPETPAQPGQPIKRLASQQPQQAEPDLSNLTYEEWEQAQADKEKAAQADPADELLNEVPDWFKGGATPPSSAPASSAPTGAEFLPEWYVGMDEQPEDAAPDWFKNMDLTSTPLAGPQSVKGAPAGSTPAPSTSAGDDVPDWFKSADTSAGDLDFNAMFVSGPPEEEQSKRSSKFAEFLPPPPEPEPAPEPEPQAEIQFEPEAELSPEPPEAVQPAELPAAPEPEFLSEIELPGAEPQQPAAEAPISAGQPEQGDAELDWMAEMPELDDLLVGDASETSGAEQQAEQQAEQDNLLDWMGGEETPVEPEPAAQQPDWMQQLATGDIPEESTEHVPGMPSNAGQTTPSNVPDWMEDMAPGSEPAESDVPEWMRGMAPAEPTPIAESQSNAPELDWLADFSSTMPPEPQTTTQSGWTERVEDEVAEPEAAPAEIDIDALLTLSDEAAKNPPPPQAPAQLPAPAVEPTSADLDFDLDAVLGPATPEVEAAPEPNMADFAALEAAQISALPAAEDVPDVVEEAPAAPAPTPAPEPPRRRRRTAEVPAEPTTPEPQPEAEPAMEIPGPHDVLPDWVSDMKPAEGPILLRIGDQELHLQDRPLNQLSEPLRQLRQRSKAATAARSAQPKTSEEEAAVAKGPLAGISDLIDVVPETAQPRTVIGGGGEFIVTALHAQRIKVIQNILGAEEELLKERALAEDEREAKQAGAAIAPKVVTQSRVKIDRFIVSLILALAVIAPFFTTILNTVPLPDTSAVTPAQKSVGQALDSVQAGRPVLVAFEYGPTGAGELDDLARTVVRDLIKKGAQPLIVSTNASGAIHAQTLLAQISTQKDELTLMGRADKPLVARQDYYVLRYLPGGAIGIRALVDALRDGSLVHTGVQVMFKYDLAGKDTNLTDDAVRSMLKTPAFVLTESPEDVRNWMEQYKVDPPADPLKIVLLSSASAASVAQTYATQPDKRVIGPLIGLRDAMIFQAQRGQKPTDKAQGLIGQRWQSIALATLVATLLILIGTALNAVNIRRRTRR